MAFPTSLLIHHWLRRYCHGFPGCLIKHRDVNRVYSALLATAGKFHIAAASSSNKMALSRHGVPLNSAKAKPWLPDGLLFIINVVCHIVATSRSRVWSENETGWSVAPPDGGQTSVLKTEPCEASSYQALGLDPGLTRPQTFYLHECLRQRHFPCLSVHKHLKVCSLE